MNAFEKFKKWSKQWSDRFLKKQKMMDTGEWTFAQKRSMISVGIPLP